MEVISAHRVGETWRVTVVLGGSERAYLLPRENIDDALQKNLTADQGVDVEALLSADPQFASLERQSSFRPAGYASIRRED